MINPRAGSAAAQPTLSPAPSLERNARLANLYPPSDICPYGEAPLVSTKRRKKSPGDAGLGWSVNESRPCYGLAVTCAYMLFARIRYVKLSGRRERPVYETAGRAIGARRRRAC